MKRTTLIFCLMLFSFVTYAQNTPIELIEKVSSNTNRVSLSQYFSEFSLLEINGDIDIDETSTLLIKFMNKQTELLDISDSDVVINSFPVFVGGVSRKSITDVNSVKTLRKTIHDNEIRTVLNGAQLYALNYKTNNETYYIERLQKFIPNSEKNLYVFYAARHMKVIDDFCNVSSTYEYAQQLESQLENYMLRETKANECVKVRLAIACPSNMEAHYGSVSNVESEITTIIQNVSANFDTELHKRIDFEIASMNVATSSSSSLDEALGGITDAPNILIEFKNWSLEGNLSTLEYDLGILFTQTDFDGTTIGRAYVDVLCRSDNKYAIIQSNLSAGKLKNVVSHEIGHNFGCPHTETGIMKSSSGSTEVPWESSSVDIINAKEQSRNCNIGDGALFGTPTADFVLAEKACKDEMIVLQGLNSRNTIAWDWSFSEGESQSGEKITTSFNSVGFKDISLVVQNDYDQCSNVSTISTKSIEVIDLVAPQITSCDIVYDTNTGMDANYGRGISNVTFGEINHDSEDVYINHLIYENNTCSEIAIASLNTTIPISVTMATDTNLGNTSTKAWIDYNNDGDFTADELILSKAFDTQTVSEEVTLDNENIVLGRVLRLRVISDSGNNSSAIPDACVKPRYGQVEDYGIIIEERLSISEFNIAEDLKLIENPFVNSATVVIPENNSFKNITINIYDNLGKWHSTNAFLPNIKNYNVSTSTLSNGIYYIAIVADGRTLKVLKGIKTD